MSWVKTQAPGFTRKRFAAATCTSWFFFWSVTAYTKDRASAGLRIAVSIMGFTTPARHVRPRQHWAADHKTATVLFLS